ncbi:hypothetical protein [Belnapia sp. F-4-1]|uniref:hypothetical protein n=1 Tax=Belnapia sp. F-4-1 TaxID=1545443 RepID=UPI0005BC62EB|nr:hypothetical protein [Belnapia sp. F-4-1]
MGRYYLSTMEKTFSFKDGKVQRTKLDMATVSAIETFDSFGAMQDYILRDLRYPKRTTHKFETYAWVPAWYNWSERLLVTRDGPRMVRGCWRNGDSEAAALALHYSDIDNDCADLPMVDEAIVRERITGLFGPVRAFTYTSWSSTDAKRKFRIVFDTSREVTREEMVRCHVTLNELAFGRQGDGSIYSAGDMLFAPPHQTETSTWQGAALDVDALLAREAELRAADPEGIAAKYDPKPKTSHHAPHRPLTEAEQAAMRQRLADQRTRTEFRGIDDPAVFNPDWRDEYPNTSVQGSHYQTMLSLLGRVWRKSGGTLSHGEMAQVFDEIDGLDGWYMRSNPNHGPDKQRDMLAFVMSQPVIDDKPKLSTAALLRIAKKGLGKR